MVILIFGVLMELLWVRFMTLVCLGRILQANAPAPNNARSGRGVIPSLLRHMPPGAW